MKKEKQLEAIVVIITGTILLYVVYKTTLFLYIGLGVGVSALAVKPLARLIAVGWYKLGDLLGFVVSKVVLGAMFYLLLVPIALIHNIFNKDVLRLKRSSESMWTMRNQKFTSKDLKNIW